MVPGFAGHALIHYPAGGALLMTDLNNFLQSKPMRAAVLVAKRSERETLDAIVASALERIASVDSSGGTFVFAAPTVAAAADLLWERLLAALDKQTNLVTLRMRMKSEASFANGATILFRALDTALEGRSIDGIVMCGGVTAEAVRHILPAVSSDGGAGGWAWVVGREDDFQTESDRIALGHGWQVFTNAQLPVPASAAPSVPDEHPDADPLPPIVPETKSAP